MGRTKEHKLLAQRSAEEHAERLGAMGYTVSIKALAQSLFLDYQRWTRGRLLEGYTLIVKEPGSDYKARLKHVYSDGYELIAQTGKIADCFSAHWPSTPLTVFAVKKLLVPYLSMPMAEGHEGCKYEIIKAHADHRSSLVQRTDQWFMLMAYHAYLAQNGKGQLLENHPFNPQAVAKTE